MSATRPTSGSYTSGSYVGEPLMATPRNLPFTSDTKVETRFRLQGVEDFDSGGRTHVGCGGIKYYDSQVLNYDAPRLRSGTSLLMCCNKGEPVLLI